MVKVIMKVMVKGDETIFVSIASYRDNACKLTLKNLYETAKKPSRVFVGICEQNNENQPRRILWKY